MTNIVAAVVIGDNGYFDGSFHAKGDPITVDLDALGIETLEGSKTLAPAEKAKPSVFDAEAFITGNVQDILPRLAALSEHDLQKVEEAEMDREAPRKGVVTAIEDVRKARA